MIATAPARRSLDEVLAAGDLVGMVDAFVAAARAAAERELMVERGRPVTGSSLADRVERTTHALARRGMQPGDVVLFGVRPGVDALVLLLACMRMGACVTFIDPGAGSELFARRLEVLRPAWVMAESLLYAASARSPLSWYMRRAGLELPRLARIPARHLRTGRRVPGLVPRAPSLQRLQREPLDRGLALPRSTPPDAPAMVIFTSGTTGEPKGVQHTGASVTGAVRMMLDGFDVPPDAVLYTHNIHTFVVAALRGARTVVAPLSITPERLLQDVERHGVTHAFLLPVEAWRLVLHCERRGIALPASLRQVFLFSAPITTTVLERIHALAADRPDAAELSITCAYAMTEMIPVAWIDSREKLAWSGDGDVVGRPVCGVEARIGEGSELLLRGPSLFHGYVGREPVDWHATGDLARIDEEGRIVLLGRRKDMLIRGDFNLYPGLYEETVSRIDGVGACAFVGVADADTGDERVVLAVEPDPASSAPPRTLRRRVERALREGDTRIDVKALPDEVRVMEALPRSGRSRKIDRIALRGMARLPAATPKTGEDVDASETWVVIPAFNEEAWLPATLDAFAEQDASGFVVLVVDNASTDDTAGAVRAAAARHPGLDARVLREDEVGIGAAADSGCRHAIEHGAKVLLRTDADCIPARDWVRLMRGAIVDDGLDIVGGRLAHRTDDGTAPRLAWLVVPLLHALVRVVGRYKPDNNRRHEHYRAPFRLAPGGNTGIRATTYLECGGYIRDRAQAEHADKELTNSVRRISSRVGYRRRALVRFSNRRVKANGVWAVLMWYLGRRNDEGDTNVR